MADLLSSDQVNYMIWRYLQESGFCESAYAFQRDSKADRLEATYKSHVKAGLLIYLIQRGLQYEEVAAQVERDGTIKKHKPFHFLPPASALVLDEDEGVGSDGNHMDDELDADGSAEDVEEDEEDGDSITLQTKASPATASLTSASAKRQHAMEDGVNGVSKKRRKKTSNSVADDGDLIMADAVPSPPLTKEIAITNGRSVGTQIEEPVEILGPDMVIVEDGCKGICAWNPVHPFLATASMGSGALIWNVPEEATSAEALERIELSHEPSRKSTDKAESMDKADVTAIRWSPEGTQLASGSYNGQTRIWSVDGRLKHAMWLHFAPPTSLKWNKTAKVLLALSCDGKMIAWDTTNGETIRMFDMGKEMMTEIEWISATQFIACGDNGNIHQFDIGVDGPLHSRTAHQGEVSCIAWDEATETVATGGADASVLIWHRPSKESKPENKLQGHTAPVVSVAWQPGAEFVPASPKRILASASNDCTVRIWEVVSQSCLRVLSRHIDPIERICFSPNGTRLASGAGGAVLVWRVESGTLTHVYDRARSQRKNGTVIPDDASEIGEISWDEGGQRLAIGGGAIGGGANKCAVVTIGPEGSTTPTTMTSNGSA